MEKFGKFVFGLLLVVISLVTSTFTLGYLWQWFVVPLGVSAISMAQAFGLTLIVTFFQVRQAPHIKPDLIIKRTYTQRLGFNIGMAMMALTIGYVTQLFM